MKTLQTFLIIGGIFALLASVTSVGHGQQQGPVIIPRSRSDPSIHEGPSGRQSAGYKQVLPFLGLVPASYDWFGGILRAVGSLIQPFAGDQGYLGYKSGQTVGYDFLGALGFKQNARPNIRPGDQPSIGQACGRNPGDAFWVGYPRPGNVEFPPLFQTSHHLFDCFCRCDENIECPIRWHPDWHVNWGGWAEYNVSCTRCFGIGRIRKHDVYVGRGRGTFPGYLRAAPGDPGYQECLRQSIESSAASGPGGSPRGGEIYGL